MFFALCFGRLLFLNMHGTLYALVLILELAIGLLSRHVNKGRTELICLNSVGKQARLFQRRQIIHSYLIFPKIFFAVGVLFFCNFYIT
jgi:hypothetical protein